MTDQTPVDGPRDFAALFDAAKKAVEPGFLTDDLLVARSDAGVDMVIDLREFEEAWAYRPWRHIGVATFRTPESFCDYVRSVAPHDGNQQRFYVADDGAVSAVFNDHGDQPGHRDHGARLTLAWTPEWQQWLGQSGKLTAQAEFAEFIEDHALELVSPDAATMLEIAQSFQATIGATLRSARRLASGEVQFLYAEEVAASAGRNGDITIPTELVVAVAPYEGAEPVEFTARFRYRFIGGHPPQLGFKIDQTASLRRRVVDAVVAQVEENLAGITVLRGSPA